MNLFKFAENTNYNFVSQRYFAFLITAIMIFGSIGLFFTKGLNYGIDFSGGIMMEVSTPSEPNLESLRNKISGLQLGNISLQEFGEKTNLMIRVPEQEGGAAAQQNAIDKVKSVLDSEYAGQSNESNAEAKVEYRRTEFVGPQVGDELKQSGAIAFGLTILAVMVYIWFQFEWQFGLAAIISMIHDTLAVIGLFSLLQMSFDLSTLAAVLLVAGYSTNDTVIVFDRVRENRRKFKKMDMKELINLSVNQTLSRTLMTSTTTLLALLALWFFGGEVIRDFVNAMVFGILVGTYSSIYVASSLLLYLPFKGDEKRENGVTTEDATA